MPNPQKRFLNKTRFTIHINKHAVSVVGGQDSILGHVGPTESQMVPLLGLTEGPEKDVVMYDIGGIPGLGVEPVEEGKGTVPRGR